MHGSRADASFPNWPMTTLRESYRILRRRRAKHTVTAVQPSQMAVGSGTLAFNSSAGANKLAVSKSRSTSSAMPSPLKSPVAQVAGPFR